MPEDSDLFSESDVSLSTLKTICVIFTCAISINIPYFKKVLTVAFPVSFWKPKTKDAPNKQPSAPTLIQKSITDDQGDKQKDRGLPHNWCEFR